MNWVRLWSDMPTDPKWRVIAKRSGRPLAEVLAVFVHMLTNAGANATERGVLANWCHDDIAAALDMEAEHVAAIYDAMQGKTLDGASLTGWGKRQPKREDGAAERAKAWRERNRTQSNADKRPDTEADTEADTDNTPLTPQGGQGAMPSNVRPIQNWSQAFAPKHTGIAIASDGTITLLNGTQTQWLESFDGDAEALRFALIEVRSRIQPNNRTHSIEHQVESQLAKIARMRRDFGPKAKAKPNVDAWKAAREIDRQKAREKARAST